VRLIAKKTIRAPFAGRLGIRQINLGQFLDTGASIVTLQSLDPVYVNFALPQQRLAQLKTGMTVRVTTDAFPDRDFEGKLTAINPEVETATRNVRMQATLANPSGLLRPGIVRRRRRRTCPVTEQVLMIPATAVLYATLRRFGVRAGREKR
jgi:membrane fusion protein (multidrug efflux system)